MKLLFRTRGNTTPQGKPRVYYTGHPEDLHAYFDEIAGDVLQSQNCAIYYDAEPAADWDREELLRQLEQMQLLVIPVTSRFLFRSSRALEVEFPFAMEHHIPVLPLMQESGLEETFNQRCGDLQMLDKSDRDPTALPYEEKLKKFLDSVLVGDELAERVRAAFDAYVFLSYRKKDRRYAQELMRLIHKNDFCRDIAIWYDEFLTPGENFNQAIAAALEKCSLFTLTVTPNIVEKDNYVITTEYPEALKAGKPVLPVEMAPTDREALRASFQDLPPCADAHEEGALSAALLEAVERLAIRENEGSAQHNFFIGLAYLNGIDVEVDRRRALNLITGAAEAGLPEAMEKLVAMYRSGDGVERDYRTAIEWQKRLTGQRRAVYARTQTKEDGVALFNTLENLGDYQQELLELAAARETYEEMLRVAGVIQSKDPRSQLYLIWAHNGLGDVSRLEGRLDQAKAHYQESSRPVFRLYYTLDFTNPREILTCRTFFITMHKGGSICMQQGDLKTAEKSLKFACSIAETTCRAFGELQDRLRLVDCYISLGDLSETMYAPFGRGNDYYLQALKLSREICEETGSAEARHALSISYSSLGKLYVSNGQLDRAKNCYLLDLEIRRRLCEETGTIQARRDLSRSYCNLGDISKSESQFDQARDYYLQALEIRRQLYEEAGTVQARRDLAASYHGLGRISKSEGQLDQAKDDYLQALEIYRQLYEETESIQACRELSSIYYDLGDVSEAKEQLLQAKDNYLQALKIRDQLCKKTETPTDYSNLADNHEKLGAVAKALGHDLVAEMYSQRAQQIREQQQKTTFDAMINYFKETEVE